MEEEELHLITKIDKEEKKKLKEGEVGNWENTKTKREIVKCYPNQEEKSYKMQKCEMIQWELYMQNKRMPRTAL